MNFENLGQQETDEDYDDDEQQSSEESVLEAFLAKQKTKKNLSRNRRNKKRTKRTKPPQNQEMVENAGNGKTFQNLPPVSGVVGSAGNFIWEFI